jgi:hypothetical protein
MKSKMILGFFLLLGSLNCFGEACGYIRSPQYIKIDNVIDVKISVSIENTECDRAMVALRIHEEGKNPSKQLYVIDNTVGVFFGNRASSITKDKATKLVDELLNEITQPKLAGDFDKASKCLPLVPNTYLDRLKKNSRNMYSYRWRSNEIRYISYIEEIDQIVVIAQCSAV